MFRGRPNKKAAQVRHAKRRANERFGMRLDNNSMIEIAKMIQRGEGAFVEKQSQRIAVWDVMWQGNPMRVVYDKLRKTPVTFMLRPDMPEQLPLKDAMSLYAAIMGENPAAGELLHLLGLNKADIPRYRDCWMTTQGDRKYIDLLTRTGGGNREHYLDEIDALRRVAWFEYDFDDEADPTFMHFVYVMPSKGVANPVAGNDAERGPAFMMKAFEIIKEHGLSEPHSNPKLEAIRQGSVAVGRRIVDALGNAPSGTVIRVADDGKITQDTGSSKE